MAGKSTFVNYLKLGEFTSPLQTMGINVEKVKKDGLDLNVIDLGGQKSFRMVLWPKILETGADAILFVIDATSKDRMVLNEEEFFKLLTAPKLKSVPIIILANKQDLSEAMTPGEIALQLKLLDYTLNQKDWGNRSLNIYPTSMKTGEGLEEVVKLLKHIYNTKKD
ncbi:MAG: GTPase Der [Candidatus Heimdallarchaeota archaeon LC_3]|nr:MAG: GTPase Der [Candidatus Heimdallarchaeota archaeon LC_3]